MKETRMPPAQSANLVANNGSTIYGVSVIQPNQIPGLMSHANTLMTSTYPASQARLHPRSLKCDLQTLHMPCTNLVPRHLVHPSHKIHNDKTGFLNSQLIIWKSEAAGPHVVMFRTSLARGYQTKLGSRCHAPTWA